MWLRTSLKALGTVGAFFGVFLGYLYEVEGRPYIGERLSNAPRLESAHVNDEPSQELKQYLARYPVGSPVQVHYNPRFPEDSLLEVEVGGAAGFTLASTVAFVSAVLGWGGLLLLFLGSRRRAAVSGSHGG